MTLYADKNNKPVYPGDVFVDSQGTRFPSNYPKDEIKELSVVEETAMPADESKVVTGFTIESGKQVWQTRDKTEEEKAAEAAAALVLQKAKAQELLQEVDRVCSRCVQAQVSFPSDWKAYADELRALYSATSLKETPKKPEAYPEGT